MARAGFVGGRRAHLWKFEMSARPSGALAMRVLPALSTHRFPLDQLGIEECPIAVNDDAFDELLLKLQPDLVFFDRFFTEEQFAWRGKHCPQAVRVLDTR